MDTIFVFVCSLLVMLMTPALALFYGGLVKSKNVLSTTFHSYATISVVSIMWVMVGYSLAFGTGNALIGSFEFAFLNNVGFAPNDTYSTEIPHSLFMMFQMMFAILTPAIMSGAFAERMRFGPFILFITLWTTLVYAPIAHWVWGDGGWLRELGALDFAGGTVVHIASGVSGLIVAIVLGKRKHAMVHTPHQVPLSILGAGLLWFGWYGFNVGSALSLNDIAMNAYITTAVAAGAGSLGWMLLEWNKKKKPSALGAANGVVAGLVAITPACGFVTPGSAIIIGLLSGFVCYYAVTNLKRVFSYDDALDAFGLHGFGGIWGAIATGIFATTSVNEAGSNGLLYGGGMELIYKQFLAIGATMAFCAVATYLIIVIIKLFVPIRVNEEEEEVGLDESLHGEKAYS